MSLGIVDSDDVMSEYIIILLYRICPYIWCMCALLYIISLLHCFVESERNSM